MRLGKAAGLLGEHHSAQRPAMAPPAWRNDPYDRRGLTAAWASANRLPKSCVNQLVAGTLPGPQFRMVKEAERAAKAASRDGLMDSRKREALVANIKKAPPAEPTRSARVAGHKGMEAHGPRAARSSSEPRGRSRGRSAASATPDASYAEVVGRRRRKSQRRLERKVAVEEAKPFATATAAEPKATDWQCADCGTANDNTMKRQCYVCEWKRDPAPMAAGATTASPVVVDTAVVLAKKQLEVAQLRGLEHVPGVEGGIATLQAEIEALQKAAVPPPAPDQYTLLRDAQWTVDAALARNVLVAKRLEGAEVRLAKVQAVQKALRLSLANGQRRHQEAMLALATTKQLVVAQPPGTTAVPTQPQPLDAVLKGALGEIMGALDASDKARAVEKITKIWTEMHAMLTGGSAVLPADVPVPTQTTAMETDASPVAAAAAADPAPLASAAASESPAAMRTPATRTSMTAGPTIKNAAQAVPSATQLAKEGAGPVQRRLDRKAAFDEKRRLEDLAFAETEDAAEESDAANSG